MFIIFSFLASPGMITTLHGARIIYLSIRPHVLSSKTEFAKILGLSSAAMTIENSNGKIKITTKGLGDGMGVSLYTADFMAKQGSSYEQILKAFYSGITIVSQ